MTSLLLTYSHFKGIMLAVLLSIILGCSSQRNSIISLSPKDFKVQVPLMINARGIIIKTYWGSENKYHVLCLDNFSPSWIKSSVIKYNKSFTQSNLRFKTSTADGTSIKGEVGICDNLAFENITFRKPPFYVMPDDFNDIRNDDGVFGGDLMSTGVWKIDFKNNELTFASNIDSLKELNQTEVFNSTFAPKYINIDVIFGSNIAKTMSIDLGYNGDLLLPLNEFNKISTSNKIFLTSSMFKTPASENIVKSLSFIDTVKINHNRFITIISSNEKVKERLIGLQFFKRFDFVIFDFINKKIYLPKKVW